MKSTYLAMFDNFSCSSICGAFLPSSKASPEDVVAASQKYQCSDHILGFSLIKSTLFFSSCGYPLQLSPGVATYFKQLKAAMQCKVSSPPSINSGR